MNDYFESDNVEVLPEEFNDKTAKKEQATIKQQVEFLQSQTKMLKESMDLEQELQVDNPLGYLNAIESQLQSLKISNLQQRIRCLAVLGSGAEKQVTLKCTLPREDNLKRFQEIEKQVHLLETIVGTKPYDYNSNIMADLNEIQKTLDSISGDVKIPQTQPQIDKVNEVFRQVQLLLGIADLLPNIIARLEELKTAHDQSIQYQTQLREMQQKHTKILELMSANRLRIRKLCEKLQQKL